MAMHILRLFHTKRGFLTKEQRRQRAQIIYIKLLQDNGLQNFKINAPQHTESTRVDAS
jgi:hypothetical protein